MFYDFFLMYWNGANLAINVVNNTIGLQVCYEFFLSDVIQLNEYIIIILSLSGVAKRLYCNYEEYA